MSDPCEVARVNAAGWRVFSAAVLIALTVPRLWQRGMFLDGLTYAAISRNMAIGVGSFWSPSLSSTAYRQFFEQPPLGLALQAFAFRLFGDHFAVERVFSLVIFALHAVVVLRIWRTLLPAQYDWLPLLFWVLPSVVTWAVVNNMLENTQALFSSAAVLALLQARGSATRNAAFAWSVLAGVSVCASVLVKGPVGLFPLAVPALLPLLRPSHRPIHAGVAVAGMYTTLAVLSAALLLYNPAREALWAFVSTHVIPALGGERGAGIKSVDVARHLALGVLARMGALVALLWVCRRSDVTARAYREADFFFAVGAAASVPIIMSPVLAGHYFVPSVPFYALGCAALALPPVASFRRVPGRPTWALPVWLAGSLLAAVVMVLTFHGAVEARDKRLIASLDRIAEIAPRGMTVGTCAQSANDWGLIAYLQRFYRISLRGDDGAKSGWFLATPGVCHVPPGCSPNVHAEAFSLFRCESAASPAVGAIRQGILLKSRACREAPRLSCTPTIDAANSHLGPIAVTPKHGVVASVAYSWSDCIRVDE